ncbi:MAG TPA: LamG-like jellyroll fold domain-containing protein, partial [Chryseolinea sp.]|nr:LamG-like jellyroll fold domain-containing protein [Chryseolinea sp.]
GNEAILTVDVEGASLNNFTYTWNVPSGTGVQQDSLLRWTTPLVDGLYTVTCSVKNEFDLEAESTALVLVKHETTSTTDPLAYYPLNIDVNDYSGNSYHAQVVGTQEAPDAVGEDGFAHRFSSANDVIFVANQTSLNFRDMITLSFWVSVGSNNREEFILSHGSWEERWKISVTPERRLRWTVKTESGVKDLDSSFPLQRNRYYHGTAVYTGYSMEMYLDGVLDEFISHNGLMFTTENALTFGQKSLEQTQYFLTGTMDEVRIYHSILQPDEISLLKTLWHDEPVTGIGDQQAELIKVFPNPSTNGEIWIDYPVEKIVEIQMIDPSGKLYPLKIVKEGERTKLVSEDFRSGIFFLKVRTQHKLDYSKIIFN